MCSFNVQCTIVTLAPGCCQSVAWFSYELNLKIQIYQTVKRVGAIQLCGRVFLFVWGGFGVWVFLFFFRKTQKHQTWQNPFIRKEKALHIWTGWKGSRGYWSIIVRFWNDLKSLNGLWREKINLVQRKKKCEEGNEELMISNMSCVNHCWGSVMTGELLIKAELLVLIDVIAGKSRI